MTNSHKYMCLSHAQTHIWLKYNFVPYTGRHVVYVCELETNTHKNVNSQDFYYLSR